MKAENTHAKATEEDFASGKAVVGMYHELGAIFSGQCEGAQL